MFPAKSWIQRAGVALLLLASLCTGSVAPPHAEELADFVCSPILVNHDENAHYVGAAPTSRAVDGQHCFLCHSLRSFYLGFEKFEQRDSTLSAEQLHAAPVAFADCLDWSLAPGRAPPV